MRKMKVLLKVAEEDKWRSPRLRYENESDDNELGDQTTHQNEETLEEEESNHIKICLKVWSFVWASPLI